MKKLLVFALLASFSISVFAQLDSIHYLAPLHNKLDCDGGRLNERRVYLSTPSTTPISVVVRNGCGAAITGSPFTVSQSSPIDILIGDSCTYNELHVTSSQLATPVWCKGLTFTSSDMFFVNERIDHDWQAESITSKGQAGLGTTFRVGYAPSQTNEWAFNFVTGIMNASGDTIEVVITDYDPAITFTQWNTNNAVTDDTLRFTLLPSQSVVIEGRIDVAHPTENRDGFIGALIESTGNISVTSGNMVGSIAGGTDADFMLDQITPVERWGDEFVLIEGDGTADMERPMVVAHYDNTEIWINGALVTTINAGDYYLVPNSYYTGTAGSQNMIINTSQPAEVFQFLGGAADERTSGSNFVPPIDCSMPNTISIMPEIDNYNGGTANSYSVIIVTVVGSTVTLNGTTLTGAEAVTGGSWETYKVDGSSIASSDIEIVSTNSVAAGYYGENVSAGFSGYYGGFSKSIFADFTLPDSLCLNTPFDIVFTGDSTTNTIFAWDLGSATVTAGGGTEAGPYTVEYAAAITDTISLTLTEGTCTIDAASKQIVVGDFCTIVSFDISFLEVTCNTFPQISFVSYLSVVGEKYIVERSYDGYFYDEVLQITVDRDFVDGTHQFTDYTASSIEQNIYYRLTSINGAEVKRSNVIQVDNCLSPLNTHDIYYSQEYISISNTDNFDMDIFDVNGRKLYSFISTNNKIDIRKNLLSKGIYFISIKNKSVISSDKIIVN